MGYYRKPPQNPKRVNTEGVQIPTVEYNNTRKGKVDIMFYIFFIIFAISTLFNVLFFSALSPRGITPLHYETATELCVNNGGLSTLSVYNNNEYMKVVCVNKAQWDKIKVEGI